MSNAPRLFSSKSLFVRSISTLLFPASRFISQAPKSVKLKLKGGAYVDPDSELQEKAHVLKSGDNLYSVVLGAVNIQDGKNSYYKLQILEHDKKKKWYVFRSWGRVGTTIGGTKLQDFEDKHEAVRDFEFLYEEKTGNRWKNRKDFKKVAGRFFPLDIDMGENSEEIKKLSAKDSKSKLAKPIQELVTLVFDIERMKSAMVEFEIDLSKMPLGKLSRKQIETAYKILTEAQDMIKNETGSESKFLDASNRFFTLIPHDFGMRSPPLLDNPDLVKHKIDMLDNLLEIEVAYSLLASDGENSDKEKDPVDAHYDKLKTEIEVVKEETEEYNILKDYVTNTHASTHTQYSLEIEQIFKISRKGEAKRFKPFRALPNRMLLWHGSRTTNFAGILSQGLRIAPPEAPVTGYMFGKGIYFADMVSKSANYCCTNKTNNTGLLMLCDVALGKLL
jgi:predicted DNA-binding WGR domain protein